MLCRIPHLPLSFPFILIFHLILETKNFVSSGKQQASHPYRKTEPLVVQKILKIDVES